MIKRATTLLKERIAPIHVIGNFPNYFDPEERRLVIQAFVIGVVVWSVVFTLKTLVHEIFEYVVLIIEHAPTYLVLFIPIVVGALIVATLAHYTGSIVHYRDKEGHIHELIDVEGDGLERAISLYYASEPSFEKSLLGDEGVDVRWRMPTFTLAIRKFLATLATLGSGGSGGLEASVTLIGESLAAGIVKPHDVIPPLNEKWSNRFWRWWRSTDPDHLQTAQLSGIAAAVSTLLGAPFAAAFFATEIMYRNRPIIEKLVYSLIASLTAFFLTSIVSDHAGIFHIEHPELPPRTIIYFLALAVTAIVISLVSVYFGRLRASFDKIFHHRQPNIWRRHIIGAIFTGTVALIFAYTVKSFHLTEEGLAFILGSGEHAIDLAMAGELTIGLALAALFAKMVATLATIGSGGSAGLLVPSLYFGTMVASVVAPLFGVPPIVVIIPAMTASLTAIANVPLAAILFAVEIFGAEYMIPALLILIVTIIFAHDNTIYRTQRQKYVQRQILPGYSTKRITVPAKWHGKTLIDLQLRNLFDMNVIGLWERKGQDGLPHVRPNPLPDIPLEEGDILVVLGKDDKLKALEHFIENLDTINKGKEE